LTVTGTLTVPSGLIIRATGSVTISGSVVVQALTPGVALSTSLPTYDSTGSGVGLGGTALNALIARQIIYPPFGSGGASGSPGATPTPNEGLGGGALVIFSGGTITVSGSVHADGVAGHAVASNTDFTGGGGAGGVLVLAASTSIVFSGAGLASARGAQGGTGSVTYAAAPGGGGGGGIIRLISPSFTGVSGSSVLVNGGAAGGGAGSPGYSGGGGACGGNGGNGSIAPTAGSAGQFIQTTADPTTQL
jgi:hypothetical protein